MRTVLAEHCGCYRKRVLGQSQVKDQKIDLLQYRGEQNPAGTIHLARYSFQIKRDPLALLHSADAEQA